MYAWRIPSAPNAIPSNVCRKFAAIFHIVSTSFALEISSSLSLFIASAISESVGVLGREVNPSVIIVSGPVSKVDHRVERTGGNDGRTTPMGRNTGVGEAATTRRKKRKERTRAKGKRARERETRPEAEIAEATEPGVPPQQTDHERTDRRAHSNGEGEEGSG